MIASRKRKYNYFVCFCYLCTFININFFCRDVLSFFTAVKCLNVALKRCEALSSSPPASGWVFGDLINITCTGICVGGGTLTCDSDGEFSSVSYTPCQGGYTHCNLLYFKLSILYGKVIGCNCQILIPLYFRSYLIKKRSKK